MVKQCRSNCQSNRLNSLKTVTAAAARFLESRGGRFLFLLGVKPNDDG